MNDQYGNPYWNQYGNSYGNQYGNSYGNQYGNSYGNQRPNMRQQVSMKADWALGEEAAKAYPTQPGMLTLLMDAEHPTLYVKQTAANGHPFPLEVYDLVKRETHQPAQNYQQQQQQQQLLPMYSQGTQPVQDMSEFVRRDELERDIADMVHKAMSSGNSGGN